MIVTIDGPAGAGKSTVARHLAERLGFEKLDTGATYRVVALALTRLDPQPDVTEKFLQDWLPTVQIGMAPGQVFLGEEEVSAIIRTSALSDLASRLGTLPSVRAFLSAWQRKYAADRNLVSEGRDQGTVVFPNAECKFYLTASPHERARRRFEELRVRDVPCTLAMIESEQAARDARDEQRSLAPLKPAPDAHIIDTTHWTSAEVVDQLEKIVRGTLGIAASSGRTRSCKKD